MIALPIIYVIKYEELLTDGDSRGVFYIVRTTAIGGAAGAVNQLNTRTICLG